MTCSRALTGLAIAGIALAWSGCSEEPPKAPAAPSAESPTRATMPDRPNLVLITMDTTRADHLGCYGDAKAQTPRLDALARAGVVFDDAVAVAPITLPAHASILTGQYPPRDGVRDNDDFRLAASETTLAEHLVSLGYRAEASVGSVVVGPETGLDQGFEAYYGVPPDTTAKLMGDPGSITPREPARRPADAVAKDAVRAIDAMKGRPFFLWVHFYDPHRPYLAPPEIRERFPDDPYDGEIAFMDSGIGRVLDALRQDGLDDTTVVVAVADHGEGLGEHGEATHELFVYDATLRIPLIVRAPAKLRPGTRFPGLVSQVDLVPTLLDLMGLPPLKTAQGRSVAAALGGASLPPREPVYAESLYAERAYGWAPLFALRSDSEKFIDAPEPELYDLKSDPGERTNLAPDRTSEVAAWRKRLRAAMLAIGTAPAAPAADDAERREKLQSLGYLSAGAPGLARKDRPDPKRMAPLHEQIMSAIYLKEQGRLDEAERLLVAVLAKDPHNPAAELYLGSIRFIKSRGAEGVDRLRAAAADAPGSWINQWNLGNALLHAGRFDEAVRALDAATRIKPQDPQSFYALGNALGRAGREREAVTAYRRARALGMSSPEFEASFGVALLQSGDAPGAERALRAAVAGDPSLADAWSELGVLLDKTRRRPEAVQAFDKALAADPDNAGALFNRGKLRLLGGDVPGARTDLDRLLAKHADYPPAPLLEASVCVAEGKVPEAKTALKRLLARPGAGPQLENAARTMLAQLGG